MGFWRWLFRRNSDRRLTAEERALQEEIARKAEERRITELYFSFVRELVLDPTAVYGFTMKIDTSYEALVIRAMAQYAIRPYTIYRTSNEDMDYEGLCNIHVSYIQFPVAAVVAKTV